MSFPLLPATLTIDYLNHLYIIDTDKHRLSAWRQERPFIPLSVVMRETEGDYVWRALFLKSSPPWRVFYYILYGGGTMKKF